MSFSFVFVSVVSKITLSAVLVVSFRVVKDNSTGGTISYIDIETADVFMSIFFRCSLGLAECDLDDIARHQTDKETSGFDIDCKNRIFFFIFNSSDVARY